MTKPPETYTIKVPTKSYLRKYIYAKNGFPLELNYNSTLGTLILCLLGKESFSINMNSMKIDVRLSYMNDHIIFTVPIKTMPYKGHSLTEQKIIAINRYMENEFAQELHKWCQEKIEKRNWRPGLDKAIYSFCEKYDIDLNEEISFEALKKAEYRFRTRTQKNLKTFVPPPSKPNSFFSFAAIS